MNCLITGGGGFIGSHLADALLQQGHRVVVLDNLRSGNPENLPEQAVLHHRSVTEDLDDVFKDQELEAVFHLAAIPSIIQTMKNPLISHETNVSGSLNILELCRKYDARFIFSSSAAVYTNGEATEESATQPPSLYGMQKLIVEKYAAYFFQLYGLPTVILRYFNVYGPRQGTEAGVIPKFINAVQNNKPITIHGDGKQTRDFVYIKDATQANMLALKTKKCGVPINIGSGAARSILDVANCISKIESNHVKIQHGPSHSSILHSQAVISRAKESLNWKSITNFRTGLRETYSHYATPLAVQK